MAQLERAQTWVRRTAQAGLARDDVRLATLAFRYPAPCPPLDFAGLEIARALAESMPLHPAAGHRLLRSPDVAPLAIVGDSHSIQLVRRAWRDGRWRLPFHLLCTGASARGLINPEAAAQAGAKVRSFLDNLVAAPIPVVFKFGQVDVEFVFTFKRLAADAKTFDEAAFDAFCAETIDRYLAFLTDATPPALKPMAQVAGIFPPALSDAAWRQGYVDAHIADLHGDGDRTALAARLAALEIPELRTRTTLHARFNARLFDAARGAGFGAFDTFEMLLGRDGVLDPRFLGRARGCNHHLGYSASRGPLVDALWNQTP